MENNSLGAGVTAPNLLSICIDNNDDTNLKARVYHCYRKDPVELNNVVQIIHYMEEFFDEISFPQSSVQMRAFIDKKDGRTIAHGEKQMDQKALMEFRGNCATFLVHVQYRQNATWQGKAVWVEQEKSVEFRSALEFVICIDNALRML